MNRNLFYIAMGFLTLNVVVVAIAVMTRKEPVWDCSDNSAAVAAWVTECSKQPYQNADNCTSPATKIFCKPVCGK